MGTTVNYPDLDRLFGEDDDTYSRRLRREAVLARYAEAEQRRLVAHWRSRWRALFTVLTGRFHVSAQADLFTHTRKLRAELVVGDPADYRIERLNPLLRACARQLAHALAPWVFAVGMPDCPIPLEAVLVDAEREVEEDFVERKQGHWNRSARKEGEK